jgi:hypothetical protein
VEEGWRIAALAGILRAERKSRAPRRSARNRDEDEISPTQGRFKSATLLNRHENRLRH